MHSVFEAQAIVLEHARALPTEHVPLAASLLGQVLAADIISDIDMPPHNQAMMDGYAVRAADLPAGQGRLTVIEEVTAGRLPRRTVGPGQASRIMTGAAIPHGADAVVPWERCPKAEESWVEVAEPALAPGKNIFTQGRQLRRGEVILPAGTPITAPVVGLLAMVGRATVPVYPRPRVAVLTTGDEVVEANQTPAPGQIRNSNGPMLLAQASRAGGVGRYLGIARDQRENLRSLIQEGLPASALVLSGGVSAGRLDLVPAVLQELGVLPHFHKVEMKPGKPVFFGTWDADPQGPCLVFGLPGNPVSSLVCFELFVRPALRRLAGHPEPFAPAVALPLAEEFAYNTDRPTYYPARLVPGSAGWSVQPLPWAGSYDLRSLARADALVLFPKGEHQHRAGQLFPVLRLE